MTGLKNSLAPAERLDFIQSWRGIAVLLVVYYHFSNRVPPQYLGMADEPTLVFHAGKIGVLIFFIISGYLITKSLVRCSDLGEFYAKRISRIWPLFILASIVIFFFLQFGNPPIVPDGPKKFFTEERSWIDLAGSLFFLEDLGFKWIDGVFWSILVELKFYFWIGLLACFRPRSVIRDFALLALVLSLLEMVLGLFSGAGYQWLTKGLNGFFIAQYLPFFAIGALLLTGKDRDLLTLLLLVAAIQTGLKSSANPDFDMLQLAGFGLALTAFLIADRALFGSRIILHIGDNSYGFYLFHQMIGLSVIKSLSGYLSYDAALGVALLLTYAIAMAGSWLVEWRYRNAFKSGLTWLFARLRINQMRVDQKLLPVTP